MKLIKWLDENLEETLLIFLLCTMTLIMGTQVVARYIFNNSLSWSEELTRYLFVWTGFLSVSYCIKKWISIKVDQLINILPTTFYVLFQFVLNSILFVFFLYLLVHSYTYLQMSIASHQLSPALGLPMQYVHMAPFVGFGLAMFRSFQQILLEGKNLLRLYRKEEVILQKGGDNVS